MHITKWDPFREMETLLEKYSNSPKKALLKHDETTMEVGDWIPSVDITETPEAFNIRAELPGVEKKDVEVSLENNILVISGTKKHETNDKKHHRFECSYGTFTRSFTLPQSVDGKNVSGAYADGVLNLQLPKQEKEIPKQIRIDIQ